MNIQVNRTDAINSETVTIGETDAGELRESFVGYWWALTPDGDEIQCDTRDEALASLVEVWCWWEFGPDSERGRAA